MKISKNGLYKLRDINDESIIIEENLSVVLFDEGNMDRKIKILANSRVEVYGFLNNIEKYNFGIKVIGENSTLKIGYLLLSGNKNLDLIGDHKLNIKIHSTLGANYSKIDKKIISIVGKKGSINLDGVLKIDKGLKQVNGNLAEENLFLSSSGKINCIPSLLVATDNVEASHSCKIEQISDEKLFYLRSRGISKKNALNMIVQSYVKTLFQCLGMLDLDFYKKITNSVLYNIEQKI